jgi:hypothetical protein
MSRSSFAEGDVVSTPTTEEAPISESQPGARSNRWVHVVAAIALAAAATASVLLTTGHHGDRSDAATATPPAPAAPTAVAPVLGSSYDSACGLTGGSSATPTFAPTTDWQAINGWYLPVTTAYGPGRRSVTGAWSCFARTPYGAVLAAWTIPSRIELSRDFTTVVRQQVLPGTGQANLLRQGQDHSQIMPPEPLGFRIDSYSNDAATISFHMRQAAADVSCTAQVHWQNASQNDWVLAIQPNGDMYSVCAPLQQATPQFVEWRSAK